MAECKGKESCTVDVPFEAFARLPKITQRLNTLLFVQASCTQPPEMIYQKNVWGLAAACTGLLICLFFVFSVRAQLNLDMINDKLLDLELHTVDDYTVQCRLNPSIYADFIKGQNFTDKDVPIVKFKEMLIRTVQAQLETRPGLMGRTEIVDISFGFNNEALLEKLEKRASALKDANFEKLKDIVQEMNEVKDKKFDQLNTPNWMWITFAEDIAFQAAVENQNFNF